MQYRLPESLYGRYRRSFIALVFLQNAACGGIVFGFSGLVTLVTQQGIETDEVSLRHISCTAISFSLFSPLFLGFIMHKAGPRCTSCLGLAICSVGMFLLSQHQLFLGSVLLAIGGRGPMIGGVHFSGLFLERRSFVLAIISCSFPLSFLIFPAFSLSNLALTHLALTYGVFLSLLTIVTLVTWPDRPITPIKSGDSSLSTSHAHPTGSFSSTIVAKRSSEPRNDIISSTPVGQWTRDVHPGFRQQLCSWSFINLVLYAPFAVLFCNSLVILVKVQVHHFLSSAPDPHLEKAIVDAFGLMMPLGIIVLPIFGSLLDRFGLAFGTILQHGLLLLYAIMMLLLPYLPQFMIFAMFLMNGWARQTAFGLIFQLLALDFSPEYYGALQGVVYTGAALLSLAHNYIVFNLLGGNVVAFNQMQFALVLFMCFLPIHWYNRGNLKSTSDKIEHFDDIELANGKTKRGDCNTVP